MFTFVCVRTERPAPPHITLATIATKTIRQLFCQSPKVESNLTRSEPMRNSLRNYFEIEKTPWLPPYADRARFQPTSEADICPEKLQVRPSHNETAVDLTLRAPSPHFFLRSASLLLLDIVVTIAGHLLNWSPSGSPHRPGSHLSRRRLAPQAVSWT